MYIPISQLSRQQARCYAPLVTRRRLKSVERKYVMALTNQQPLVRSHRRRRFAISIVLAVRILRGVEWDIGTGRGGRRGGGTAARWSRWCWRVYCLLIMLAGALFVDVALYITHDRHCLLPKSWQLIKLSFERVYILYIWHPVCVLSTSPTHTLPFPCATNVVTVSSLVCRLMTSRLAGTKWMRGPAYRACPAEEGVSE